MSQIKNYYAGSNSSLGFYSLFNEALKGLDKYWILKGGPGTGKSTLMKKIGKQMAELGLDVEYLHCSSDNDSIDGVIIPKLKVGIVDGTAPHIIDPKYPGVVDEIINLGEFRDDAQLRFNKEQIIALTDQISEQFQKAYIKFAEAKKVHECKEEIYLSAMDFNKADEVIKRLKDQIIPNSIEGLESNRISRRLFFGAATPKGPVNFINNLTENIHTRYIIKGRSGSGKSTLMKRIANDAEQKGLTVDYFHCAFDPTSIDMIIIPALSVAILDGTPPHPIAATRVNDEIIDMFELCINPEVEVHKEKEIKGIEETYKRLMGEGTNHLKQAKELHDQLESYYSKTMDFQKIEQLGDELTQSIKQLIEV